MLLLSTRRRTIILVAALICWATVATSLYELEGNADESWFLHVANRMLQGEVLYRDIFFGVPPLSIYVMAGAALLAGSQILVLRALNCLCVVLLVCLCARMARRAGASDRAIILMALAMPLFADPRPGSLYGIMATLFFVSSALPTTPILAGILAGLAFASKQTVGVLAMAALMSGWALQRRFSWRHASWAIAGFGSTAILVLLPVLWSGGFEAFLKFAFVNKTVYLRTAALNHFTWEHVNPWPLVEKHRIYLAVAWWLPASFPFFLPLSLLILGWRLFRNPNPDPRRMAILIFGVFSLLLFYPRADEAHVRHAAPSLLLAAAVIGKRPPRAWIALPIAGLLLHSLAIWYAAPAYHVWSGGLVASNLPHFRGVLFKPETHRKWQRQLPLMQDAAHAYGPMFLQAQSAPFIYLAGEVKSQTPFDYPAVSVFGKRGESEIISGLQSGRLRSVCFKDDFKDQLRPTILTNFIETKLIPGPDLGACRVYLRRSTP